MRKPACRPSPCLGLQWCGFHALSPLYSFWTERCVCWHDIPTSKGLVPILQNCCENLTARMTVKIQRLLQWEGGMASHSQNKEGWGHGSTTANRAHLALSPPPPPPQLVTCLAGHTLGPHTNPFLLKIWYDLILWILSNHSFPLLSSRSHQGGKTLVAFMNR